MCVHKSIPKHTNCKTCLTTEPSTSEANSSCSDEESYNLEVDIQAGYHMVMSRNTTYDNVSKGKSKGKFVPLLN